MIVDPNSYDHFDFNQTEIMMRLGKLGRQLGLVRLFYQDSTLPSSSTKKKQSIVLSFLKIYKRD
jgi:hypothetical protein